MKTAILIAMLTATIATDALAACDLKVGKVADGDTFYSPTTIVVTPSYRIRRNTRFRLHGVYAPERREPGYDAAKSDLSALIADRFVAVKVFEKEHDPYGGLIVDVYLCDGTHVNRIMREKGWADRGRGARRSKEKRS